MSHGAGDAGACGVPSPTPGAQVPPAQPAVDCEAAVHQLSPQVTPDDVLSSLLRGASEELVRILEKDHQTGAGLAEGAHDPRDLGVRRLVPDDYADPEEPSQTGAAL